MTNFERVINLIGQLTEVSVTSNDGVLINIPVQIDSYDIDDEEKQVSFGDLDEHEILICDSDIIKIEENVVWLKKYLLVFKV